MKKILIVDDSALIRSMVSGFLQDRGFDVISAENGMEGILQTYAQVPDLILMDVEMPLLKGYQASRLLKSRRGVSAIPIIMHTTLSEDKDKFWGLSAGADAFINKDFDHLENLAQTIHSLIEKKGPVNLEAIREDGESLNQDRVFQMISDMLDQKLFQSTILNAIGDMVKCQGLMESTRATFTVLKKVCDFDVAVLMLRYHKKPHAYVFSGQNLSKNEIDEFNSICMHDFLENFPDLNVDETQVFLLEKPLPTSVSSIKAISSYFCLPLKGRGEAIMGTLHLGNKNNNYFSKTINENIEIFGKGLSPVLENILLFEQQVELENKIRNVFSKFVPAEIINDLVDKEHSVSALLTGEKRQVAVLFSDIRSFTTISENNKPEAIVAFLNIYFEKMVSIITSHGGSIDKFIGDAILAVFGAPTSYEDNAMRSVKAAQEMIDALPSMVLDNLVLPAGGLNIGIGIHEGDAIVGNIGSKEKFDYTVIGDTVNLASRLEGLTKHYHQQLIISEAVYKKTATLDLLMREIDRVKVKGKDKPTSIFGVQSKTNLVFAPDSLGDFEKALSMYKMRNWNTALSLFQDLLDQNPEDYICSMLLKRCKNFIQSPPDPDWDGAQDLDFK